MFPFGIFPFNVLPTANPWWPVQVAQMQAGDKEAMPPMFKAYWDAYNTWVAMMTKVNPWLTAGNQPPEKK